MRDNALVIPSRADGEGTRNRSKIHARNAFAVHEASPRIGRFLVLCNLKANVRPFGPSRTGIGLRGSG